MTLHLISVLDRSGSMHGTEQEVVSGYNSHIQKHLEIAKSSKEELLVTLILFSSVVDELYSAVPISKVPELTIEDFKVGGMTAMYDAIGLAIKEFDKEKNVIFFIETDGGENASTQYNKHTLADLIKNKKEAGWDFNFVGADLDTATTSAYANNIGIEQNKTQVFAKTGRGYAARNDFFLASTQAYLDTI